jgi:two-component system chemotaxis sensor kinase CheA
MSMGKIMNAEASGISPTDAVDEDIIVGFRTEALDLLENADSQITALEQGGGSAESVNALFRAFHTIKGNAACCGFSRIKEFAHGLESFLDDVRKGTLAIHPGLVDSMLAGKDHLARLIIHCTELECIATERDFTLLGMLESNRRNVEPGAQPGQTADASALPTPVDRGAGAVTTREAGRGGDQHGSSTVRIEENRLEGFFSSVGELLNFVQFYQSMQRALEDNRDQAATVREWKGTNRNFGILVDKLQRQVCELRQVPIRPLLQKISRLVRDAARSIGKDVTVDLVGAESLIEKPFLDIAEAPLIHLARNAVDHGLETAQVRLSGGKPAVGLIRISVATTRDAYRFTVEDDGRGVDAAKVVAKALAKGLISADQAAATTETEATKLLFLPGFSTAEQVTELSGRGVGLDVVADAVERRRGDVQVESRLGHGTKFILTFPRSGTAMVAEALQVRVGNEPYLVPLESLCETLDLAPGAVSRLPSGDQVVSVRGETLRFVALGNVFGTANSSPPRAAIVVRDRQRTMVLGIERAEGLQKVAVKAAVDPLIERPYLRGTAVLGTGQVGLVLNVEHFFR